MSGPAIRFEAWCCAALALALGCSFEQPVGQAGDRQYEIRPLVKLASSLGIEEVDSAEAEVTGPGANGQLKFGLQVDRDEKKLRGTLRLPEGMTSCSVTVRIYDRQHRKIGQGAYSLGPRDVAVGWCKTATLGIESAKPRIVSVSASPETAGINDTVRLTAIAVDSFQGSVVKYAWASNGTAFSDTTASGALKVAWPDSGRKPVLVKVLDDDGLWSPAGTCVVRVNLNPPTVTAMRDTAVSLAVTDSARITVHATDVNAGGSIARYLWDVGADGTWDDSSATGTRTIRSLAGGPVTVRWAARDDDGVLAADTFIVRFNRPPAAPSVSAPSSGTAWKNFSPQTGKGTLPLALSATDPDGVADTLAYVLSTGSSAGSLTPQYSGTATAVDLAGVAPSATVFWRLKVTDLLGDTCSATGTFAAPAGPAPAGMRFITGGTFQMGSVADADEKPVHSVTVSSFWMDSTEVTQADYRALMGVNPSRFTGDLRRPVEQVTWFDAVLYCNKRSKRDGIDTVYSYTGVNGVAGNGCQELTGLAIGFSKNGYRLPTEAEWEYACRGGATTAFYWGDATDAATVGAYAWYAVNSDSTTRPVAQKAKNAYGLFDMCGNVWEWCSDWYGPYGSASQTDPRGAVEGASDTRVMRGGSWYFDTDLLRSSYRYKHYPYWYDSDCGFRVVRRGL